MHTDHTRRHSLARVAASIAGGVALAVALAGCQGTGPSAAPTEAGRTALSPTTASFTASSGSQSTLLGRATFPDFKVKRKGDDWSVDIKSSATDVAVQSITFQPGSNSGWHSHPGPVLIQVVSGTMTFYESDDPTCTPEVRTAGQGYLDVGDHAHIARNETGVPATNVVTYFAPVGAALRIDAPNPGNCPF